MTWHTALKRELQQSYHVDLWVESGPRQDGLHLFHYLELQAHSGGRSQTTFSLSASLHKHSAAGTFPRACTASLTIQRDSHGANTSPGVMILSIEELFSFFFFMQWSARMEHSTPISNINSLPAPVVILGDSWFHLGRLADIYQQKSAMQQLH